MNPMGYLWAVLYGMGLLALSFVVYRLGASKLYTRKLVHIGIGAEFFILDAFFGPSIQFILVCIAFTAALFVNHRVRIFRMMESDGDNDPGSVYYGVSMVVMAVVTYLMPDSMPYFGCAVLVLSVGDGFAGIVGASVRRHNPVFYRNKSLFGSLSMAITSFVALLIYRPYSGLSIYECLCLSLLACGCEILSRCGRDNLFVPLISFFYLILTHSISAFRDGALGIALTPLLVVLTVCTRKLTMRGAVTAALVNLTVSLSLGDRGFWLLILYFALCGVADHLKRTDIGDHAKKGECRDELQVLANGFIGTLAAFLYFISADTAFLFGFLIAFSESLGDTVASGMGSRSRATYDIFRRCAVEAGTSGGVSLFGSFCALVAIVAFSAIFGLVFSLNLWWVLLAALISYLGVFIDSALGSLVQARYQCTVCDRQTEQSHHCGRSARQISGIPHFDNDLVNFLSGAAATFVGCLAFFFLF